MEYLKFELVVISEIHLPRVEKVYFSSKEEAFTFVKSLASCDQCTFKAFYLYFKKHLIFSACKFEDE